MVFDELDYQLACQAYLWSLPLVSYAQWQQQHRDVFGAGLYDVVKSASKHGGDEVATGREVAVITTRWPGASMPS